MSIAPDPTDKVTDPGESTVRVLVTGSRLWSDQKVIYDALDLLARRSVVTVVHGACPKGADYWAARWARENSIYGETHEDAHPADWQRHGKRAGFIRNAQMARLGADLCLAFILNRSNGAAHCAGHAEAQGIPVVYFRQEYPDLAQIADALALSASPREVGKL